MSVSLSTGAIMECYMNPTAPDKIKPVVQIIDIKKIGSAPSASGALPSTRYRLVVSDGAHYQQAMLATQLNALIETGKLKDKCIVQLQEFLCNNVAEKKIMIILALQIVDPGTGATIGNPQSVDASAGATRITPQTSTPPSFGGNSGASSSMTSGSRPQTTTPTRAVPTPGQTSMRSSGTNQHYHPISSLNPYQNRWTIKARVTAKSEIKTWNNQKGDGRLFSIDLLDQHGGQIRATMFNEAANKFFPIIQQDKVYSISKGNLKLANAKFSHLPNQYEITLNADAEIAFLGEDEAIERQRFDFVRIDALINVNPEEHVDVIGIVVNVTELTSVVSQKTQKQLTKRTISITDTSTKAVDITLWGESAKQYTAQELAGHPVIAIKSCRVSEFGGRSLGTTFSSQIFINPNTSEAVALREWYASQDRHSIESISNKMGRGGNGPEVRKALVQIKDEKLGMDGKADVIACPSTITYFKRDFGSDKMPWYLACPNRECNKKVNTSDIDGSVNCDKCNRTYPEGGIPRYILNFIICDYSGSCWITAFNEQAEQILEVSASKLQEYKMQGNEAAFEAVFQRAVFKSFVFKIRAKMEQGMDEQRVRCHAVGAASIDYRRESQMLLEEIERYG